MILGKIVLCVILTSAAWAQVTAPSSASPTAASASQPEAGTPSPTAASAPQTRSTGAPDDLAQMRLDLDHMDSLLNNMSSEITFLRDQNLQILLNTNARMWTILIRDLRQQLNREEQRRSHPSAASSPSEPPTEKPSGKSRPK